MGRPLMRRRKSTTQLSKIQASPPPPAPTAPLSSQPMSGGGFISGIGSTILQGFAFGTGSSLAREAVNGVFGGNNSSQNNPSQPIPESKYKGSHNCDNNNKTFINCLQENNNNSTACESYFNDLQACQSRM